MTSKCPVCGNKRNSIFKSQILNKYDISYFYCDLCGFLQTEEPYWLEEAYSSAISDTDTGLVARNISISKKLACILFMFFDKEGKYLDVAGGYGMLTRLMRDIGFDFYWSDLYCKNILAKGFEISNIDKPFSAITAFEVLEHVYDPIEFIQTSLNDAQSSTIIFSTELFQGYPPTPQSWFYYAFESGQHISFYQAQTLKFIAKKLSLYYYSYNGIHILTTKKINKQIILNIVTSRWSNLFVNYINRKMDCKTLVDHKYLINHI
jgi:2-polyprenyl-3-methyl-5-hydroxy-6-metoxy-1,4-benzoquinol methylase